MAGGPGWPPGLRPVCLCRRDLGLRFMPPLEGGLLLLDLFTLRRFSSPVRAVRNSRVRPDSG
jgi:hypothetical protein